MVRSFRQALVVGMALTLMLMFVGGGQSEDKPEKPAKPAKPNREDLEKGFAERLSGATLTGHFSVVGKEMKSGNPERYELKKVSKVQGDFWQFEARIKYGQTDVTVPLVLKVVWAEETPMITLTDATLPGLGAGFSTRVLFDNDRYAGTWQHGKIGGHMWGTIEKAAPEKDVSKDDKAGPSK
jgi:hypothetical protein